MVHYPNIERSYGAFAPGKRERARRRIVRLLNIFIYLIIFEGVLRKWIFPEFSDVFLFVRDPIVVMIYGFSLIYFSQKVGGWIFYYLALCELFFVLSFIQLISASYNIIIIFVAFRYYLFFIPLAFIMADVLNRNDIYYLCRAILYISVPIAVLIVIQFYSPLSSFFNKGASLDDFIFQVVDGVVRPYGPFTFAAGQVYFAVFALSTMLVCWHAPKPQRPHKLWLVLGSVACLIMGALSGSRSYFLGAAVVFITYFFIGIFAIHAHAKIRVAVTGGLLLIVFLALFILVFPEAFTTFSERQESAVQSEGSTFGRILFIFSEFIGVISDTPFFGFGVGFGTNAGTFVSTGERGFNLAEYEWTRLVQELGPLIGIFIIGVRVLLLINLCVVALRASRYLENPGPGAIVGFCGPLVLIGQITTQNTILGLTWFSVGLLLAMSKSRDENDPSRSRVENVPIPFRTAASSH